MAVIDRIRDIRKRNGMSQIAKALNVLVHYLIDWAEDADALASANALSPEALHVAGEGIVDVNYKPRGRTCGGLGIRRVRPCLACNRTRLTLLRRDNRNQQDNLRAGLPIQILVERLGARIVGRVDVRQYGQVDWLAACNVSHVLNLLSGYTILYVDAGCNMHRRDIMSHPKSHKREGGSNA